MSLHKYTVQDGRLWYSVDDSTPRDVTMEWFGAVCHNIMIGVDAGIRPDGYARMEKALRRRVMYRKIQRYARSHC